MATTLDAKHQQSRQGQQLLKMELFLQQPIAMKSLIEQFELLAFTETKLKGNGEVPSCGVNSFIAGVQERTSKGVVASMNDVWNSSVIDFRCVSSRTLWIKFKFSMVYGPIENVKERESFFNGWDRVVDIIGNGYRLKMERSEWIGWR